MDWFGAFAIIVVALAVAATGWALFVVAIDSMTGEWFQRCPHCHRLGLTHHGVRHPEGCPSHGVVHLSIHTPSIRRHARP